jgi:hypothetical protein
MTTVKEMKRKNIIPDRQNNIGYITQFMKSPCHHGMARPQVLDGGMASNMEGSCEYIKQLQIANKGCSSSMGFG